MMRFGPRARTSQWSPWMQELLKQFLTPPPFLQQENPTASSNEVEEKEGSTPPAQTMVPDSSGKRDKRASKSTLNHNSEPGPRRLDNTADNDSYTAASYGGGASNFTQTQNKSSNPAQTGQSKNKSKVNHQNSVKASPNVTPKADAKGASGLKGKSKGDVKRQWQGLFRQLDMPLNLPAMYGWQVTGAQRVESVVQVATEGGNYAVKRTHIPPERVEFIHEVLEYVKKKGFAQYSSFALTEKQKPYVKLQGETFYATRWIQGNAANFAFPIQIGSAAKTLAEFHEASRGFESELYNPPMAHNILDMTRQRARELRQLVAHATQNASPDAFDETMVSLGSSLIQDAEKSVRLLSSEECQEFLERDEESPGICHLDVIPGNLVYNPKKQMILIDFDLATYAPRALDLSHLLRRSLQQANWSSEIAYACFLHFNEVRTIEPAEYQLIQGLLTFPYRAWRLAHTRYRVFKEFEQTEALKDYAAQEERRQAFLAALAKELSGQSPQG
ncbi:aminoglycoside phosphotransferase family protein [Alicyclobacillus tolerans]|uniref:CotS family spore coat protein n=1 Tax=Alicyclobacillus tolerans TaxID=90970 RepID=UPI001F3D1249|nr:CotS family spore coat protein [Alicyclobacillus tolerans]MCF8563885.1 aminoglycoside phosphotransferase family protein [Alicyclobacillus tolerans]